MSSTPSIPYREGLDRKNVHAKRRRNHACLNRNYHNQAEPHPNRTPKSAIIGHISGVVRRSMEVESRIQPKIIRITMNSKTTLIGRAYAGFQRNP